MSNFFYASILGLFIAIVGCIMVFQVISIDATIIAISTNTITVKWTDGHTFTATINSNPGTHKINDIIVIYYVHQNPKKISLKQISFYYISWIVLLLGAIINIIFLALGIWQNVKRKEYIVV